MTTVKDLFLKIVYSCRPSPLLIIYPIIFLFKKISQLQKIPIVFIKIAQQTDFIRPGLAMAVLQIALSLTQCLTDSSFSYCVSHVTPQSSSVKAFSWYQQSFPLLVIFSNICLTTHIFEISGLLSSSGKGRVSNLIF